MNAMPTAKDFFEDYTSSVTKGYWDDYHDNSQWTVCVTQIIRRIIEKYGLTSQTEYYRIDITGWKSHWEEISDQASKLGLNPHLWDLEIAIEHENSSSDWTDELVKLVHIRCPLKVIIGYTPCDMRGTGGLEDQRLAFASELMKKVKAFDPGAREQYLIIFGNSAPKDSKSPTYSDYGYRGYIYDSDRNAFVELLPSADAQVCCML